MHVIDHTRCTALVNGTSHTVLYNGQSLQFLDAIIPRIGASVTGLGAAVINQFELMGAVTPTQSDALLRARDKLRCLQKLALAGVPVPRTAMVSHRGHLRYLLGDLGGLPVVVKILESTHGIGVTLAETPYRLEAAIDGYLRLHERVLLQEYIAEAEGSDIRVLVVDGAVVAAMRRQAQTGDFRSNLHRGATAEPYELSEAETKLVLRVTELMELDVAGVDLLPSNRGPLVMEVNASPGLQGIETITGQDVSGAIIDMIERRYADRINSPS